MAVMPFKSDIPDFLLIAIEILDRHIMPAQDDVESMRTRIKCALKKVESTLEDAKPASATVMLDQSSVGRLSRMDAMQQQAMAEGLRERLVQQQRRLIASLGRLEAGMYGICCSCQEAIPIQRLQADPATPFCSGCQQEVDEKNLGR